MLRVPGITVTDLHRDADHPDLHLSLWVPIGIRPGLAVLMATGYSDQEIAPLLEENPGVASLRKPFSMKEIQKKIADLGIRPANA